MMRMVAGYRLVLPLALALVGGACDNPVEHEDDHPVGLVVVNAQGQEVARHTVTAGTTGQVSVSRSAPATFQVFALAEDGDRIEIGGEVGLKVGVGGNVASATLQNNGRVVVTGLATGSGTLQLTITHEGHDEFRANLPLQVGS